MDISAISSSLLLNISSNASQTGDAVTVSIMRKALDIQSAQAAQLIESVTQSVPGPAIRVGQSIDVKA